MTIETSVGATFGALDAELPRFEKHLIASRKSPRTVESYLESCGQMVAFLRAQGMPLEAASVKREHIESWLVDLDARGRSPATIALHILNIGDGATMPRVYNEEKSHEIRDIFVTTDRFYHKCVICGPVATQGRRLEPL